MCPPYKVLRHAPAVVTEVQEWQSVVFTGIPGSRVEQLASIGACTDPGMSLHSTTQQN